MRLIYATLLVSILLHVDAGYSKQDGKSKGMKRRDHRGKRNDYALLALTLDSFIELFVPITNFCRAFERCDVK